MIIQKQILKSKNELQAAIQKINSSKIIVYEDVTKKAAEAIIKELPSKKFKVIIVEI